jgi:hypothetical protein
MCRISYIVYVYIKANTHRTRLKFAKAIEEIEIVRRDLPLHLSSSFPATEDDKQWETEHPWIPFQRYLIAYVIDFVLLSIARVLIPTNPEDDSANSRQLALQSASRILNRYATPVPRVYRLVWTVSAATVAAAVYISLDMLANSHDYRGDSRLQTINLLKQASVEFKKHTVVAAHAAKGSVFLDGLLPLLEQHDFDHPRTSYTMQDMLQQITAADMGVPSESQTMPDSGLDGLTQMGNYEAMDMFDGTGNTFDGTYGMNAWDHIFSQL